MSIKSAIALLLLVGCGAPDLSEPIIFSGQCCQVPFRNDNKYEPLDHSMNGKPCKVAQSEYEYATIETVHYYGGDDNLYSYDHHMMYGGYTPDQMAAKQGITILNVRLWTQTGDGVVECRQDPSWLEVMATDGVILSDWECECVGNFNVDMPNPFEGLE